MSHDSRTTAWTKVERKSTNSMGKVETKVASLNVDYDALTVAELMNQKEILTRFGEKAAADNRESIFDQIASKIVTINEKIAAKS